MPEAEQRYEVRAYSGGTTGKTSRYCETVAEALEVYRVWANGRIHGKLVELIDHRSQKMLASTEGGPDA